MTSSIIAEIPIISPYRKAELDIFTAAAGGATRYILFTICGQADRKRDDERTVALTPDQFGHYEGPTRKSQAWKLFATS
jgi:hypothetical protein